MSEETAPVRTEADVVSVRQVVRARSMGLGFSLVEQTKMVTAASELARNTVIHGRGGQVRVITMNDNNRKGLKLVFEDHGPGIPDISLALRDGYTTGSGLGMGLGGAKRLVNEFEIQSKPNEGTIVSITRWRQ